MEINKFNRSTVKGLRVEMDAALAEISKKYGIKISTGNASFTGDEVTFKVKANVIDSETGNVLTQEAKNFEIYKNSIGLSSLSVGDTIKLRGKSYTITGYNTRARKSPIGIKDASGRSYKCSVDMIKMSI